MNSLKKLKRAIEEIEKQNNPHPERLYPGDFVRCTVDGEVYIVTVRWDEGLRVYKWNFISIETGLSLESVYFDDWVSCTSGSEVERDEFWEDSDTDWEVLNIHDKEDIEDNE